ncbi:hypothetical protein N9219_02305 [bacterium]|nr:hypothetical protein [bacterium]
MEITGKILEYESGNRERYRLLFGIHTVTWECLAGSAAGSSGTDSYGAIGINLRPTHPSNRDKRPARIFSDSQKREKRI